MVKSVTLLTRYFNYTNAGVGRISMELKKHLESDGVKVVPVSTEGKSVYSYLKYAVIDLASYRNLVKQNLAIDTEVYHAITPFESIWIPKEKSVVTICDLIPMLHPELQGAGVGYSKWKSDFTHHYFTWAVKQAIKARYVVTLAEDTRRDIIKLFNLPEDKVKVIRLGIPSDLEPRPKPDKTFRIGYIGQLDRRKRVDLLIQAFKESRIKGELVIAGTGADGPALQALAGDDKRIKFLGFIPDAELCNFYNSLSVFAFPTSIEGYGLPIIEAMACKKPVIVREDAILPNEIKNRCHTWNGVPLEARLDTIFIDELMDYNYEFAKQHNWANCVSEYSKLYSEVADG